VGGPFGKLDVCEIQARADPSPKSGLGMTGGGRGSFDRGWDEARAGARAEAGERREQHGSRPIFCVLLNPAVVDAELSKQ
jgi:hypothetical protein